MKFNDILNCIPAPPMQSATVLHNKRAFGLRDAFRCMAPPRGDRSKFHGKFAFASCDAFVFGRQSIRQCELESMEFDWQLLGSGLISWKEGSGDVELIDR